MLNISQPKKGLKGGRQKEKGSGKGCGRGAVWTTHLPHPLPRHLLMVPNKSSLSSKSEIQDKTPEKSLEGLIENLRFIVQ